LHQVLGLGRDVGAHVEHRGNRICVDVCKSDASG
jgi:hypothetical protein